MAEASIRVDLLNPGQVFACLGFLEAAEVLLGGAEGGFDWHDDGITVFRLRTAAIENPIETVLRFVMDADVEWLSHDPAIGERDGGNTSVLPGMSASKEPKAPDLPGRFNGTFKGQTRVIHFGYWADGSSRFNTTFKKSTNGASSHIRLENARKALRTIYSERCLVEPFEVGVNTESLFRLDPRGSVDPIHAGFSPDKLRKGGIEMRVAAYPICETMAIVGLEHARPEELLKNGRRLFRYHVWSSRKSDSKKEAILLPPPLARVAIHGSLTFLKTRTFSVEHEEVKKGGDRKMNSTVEETNT